MTATTQKQRKWIFFDPTPERRLKTLPPPPTVEETLEYLDSQECPLNDIIVGPANEGNMKILRRFAFTALQNPYHQCRGMNFGLYGSAGQGKTYVAKQWAKAIGIPLVFIQSPALSDTWMLFQKICDEFQRTQSVEIVPYQHENNYKLPPCIVALDEAHRLKPSLMRGGLLNPMEHNDAKMLCKVPGLKGESVTVQTDNVCWIAMTTDCGLLDEAFESRLEHITWAPAGPKELQQIVSFQMRKEYEAGELRVPFSDDAARWVTRYSTIPRTALAFARKMVMAKFMEQGTWQEAAEEVARNMGIDQWGMTNKQVAVLTALGQRPISKAHLAVVAHSHIEELERYILPPLQAYINGGPVIVSISGRGMALTKVGLLELEKRGLTHKGEKITAEYLEQRRK